MRHYDSSGIGYRMSVDGCEAIEEEEILSTPDNTHSYFSKSSINDVHTLPMDFFAIR